MGDTSRHFTYFKANNFKRFHTLELENIGQFNVIVGDNNIGKTSVLEALLVDNPGRTWLNNIFTSLSYRNIKSSFSYRDLEFLCNQELYFKSTEFEVSLFSRNKSGSLDNYYLKFEKIQQTVSLKGFGDALSSFYFSEPAGFNNSDLNVPFISLYSGHDRNLTNFYSRIVQKDISLKRKIRALMKVMIPRFDNIELSAPFSDQPPYLIVSQDDQDTTLPIALFGDGSIKLFRILLEIIANQGKRLMIDEIDSGIHYSRFKEFWRVVLRTAKDNDVQLFMTTHNEECLKFFVEVLLEENMKDLQGEARNITLIELPDKSVKAYTYSFDHLEANLSVGNEIRGGGK